MKKVIKKYEPTIYMFAVFIAMLLLLNLVTSCEEDRERRELINCKYQGAIVIDLWDGRQMGANMNYTISHQGKIMHVETYAIDASYAVGDTINKPCIGAVE